MTAFYDNKPSTLEAVGNGSFLYRWDIQEAASESNSQATAAEDGSEVETTTEEQRTQWQCEEAVVWSPLTANKITEAVIATKWDGNYEQKLVNEYNGAQLGVYGSKTSEEAKARIQAYTDFLAERYALKQQVDADCAELGIA